MYTAIGTKGKNHSFSWFSKKDQKKMEMTMLPEECISNIISFTSPRDACRLSLVSPLFRSAVDSDVLWRKFLPNDHRQILSKSGLASSMDSISGKDLFFYLCHHPVVVDNGDMSFAIDRESGKKCYMLGARRLSIAWGDTPIHWRWRSVPAESRFSEMAELWVVWWLDIKGRIETNMLSPKTRYAAYFVYKLKEKTYGFQERPVKLRVYFEGQENQEVHGHGNGDETSNSTATTSVFLDPPQYMPQQSKNRGDGWMEVEMGEFFNDGGEDDDHKVVVFSLLEIDNHTTKFGLVVEGIELRPK